MPDGRTDQLLDIGPIVESYFLSSQLQEQESQEVRLSLGRPINIHRDYYHLFDWAWQSNFLDQPYFDLVRDRALTLSRAAGEITEILASCALPGLIGEYDSDQTYLSKAQTDQLITEVELARLKLAPTRRNLGRVVNIGFHHDGSRVTKDSVLGDIEITGYRTPPQEYLQKKVRRLAKARLRYPEVFRSFTRVDLVVPMGVEVLELEGINEPFRLPHTYWQGADFVAEWYYNYHPENRSPLSEIRPELETQIINEFVPPARNRYFIPGFASI